jgi:hypothetical protein
MSPVLQPPWPVQLFSPLQSCLAVAAAEDAAEPELSLEQPEIPIEPATNPAMAAEIIIVFAVFVIVMVSPCHWVCLSLLAMESAVCGETISTGKMEAHSCSGCNLSLMV